jgi:hypothetical protein
MQMLRLGKMVGYQGNLPLSFLIKPEFHKSLEMRSLAISMLLSSGLNSELEPKYPGFSVNSCHFLKDQTNEV